MKVLHLVKTNAGATWALRQMRELVKSGVNVHVAVPPGGPMPERYEAAGVTVHILNTDLALSPPLLARRLAALRGLVAHLQPDLIHSHFVGTTLAMRLALGPRHAVPRLFQVPGPLHLEHWPLSRFEVAMAGPSDYWIGTCRWTCEKYRSLGVPQHRLFLSYYGTDVERFVDQPGGALRKELGLSSEEHVVGMVAFMYPPKRWLGQRRGLKGHEDLIDALHICQHSASDLVGVFVGGAWNGAEAYEQSVVRYGRERCRDRAFFLGTRRDVPRLYPDFDLAVHPSHSENVGGAAESLLASCPTVATAVGGLPDLVQDGRTGWLVPPGDPDRLADAIMRALRDPLEAKARARRGSILARQALDVKRTALEALGIYEAVLAHHAGSGRCR